MNVPRRVFTLVFVVATLASTSNALADEWSGNTVEQSDDDPKLQNLVTAGLQIDALLPNDILNDNGVFDDGVQFTNNNVYFKGPNSFFQRQDDVAVDDVRLLLGYDRILWNGLTGGVRVGYAFGSRSWVIGFHFEVQLKYFPLESLIPPKSLFTPRPYIYTGFGFANVRSGVAVDVCDTVQPNGDVIDPKTVSPDDVARCGVGAVHVAGGEVSQFTGPLFIPLGVGAIFPLHKNFGINVELKTMFMLDSGVVLAPFIGPVGMF